MKPIGLLPVSYILSRGLSFSADMVKTTPIAALEDLWIGDAIIHTPSGLRGRFEGVDGGQLILVNAAKESSLHPLHECQLIDESEEGVAESSASENYLEHRMPEDSIDLHISALDPTRIHEDPIILRQYQIRRCREFIEAAINARLRAFVIIHGRGEGVLESDVLALVHRFLPEARVERIHEGGAHRILIPSTF
ncbi:MAG: Smr/MutS family protein [Saprospiraceae bacterium]|nr:Smr/MutS family protein [Saprospiraceae bacterium]